MLFGKEIRGTDARSFFPWLRLFIGFGMHGSNIITILGALHPRKNQTLLSESTSLVDHWRLNCAFLKVKQLIFSGAGTEMQGLSHGPTVLCSTLCKAISPSYA